MSIADLLGVPELVRPDLPKVDSAPLLGELLVATEPHEIRTVNIALLSNIIKELPDDCFDGLCNLVNPENILCIHRLFSQIAIYFREVHQIQSNGTYQLHTENSVCDDSCQAKRFIEVFFLDKSKQDEVAHSLQTTTVNLLSILKTFQKENVKGKDVDTQIQAFDLAWRAYLLQRT